MSAHQLVGIDHVQVAIPKDSEPAAREFYVGKLGIPEIPKPENLRTLLRQPGSAVKCQWK